MREPVRDQKEQDSTNFFIGIAIMIIGLIILFAIISLIVRFVTNPGSPEADTGSESVAEQPAAEETESSESWFSKITSIFSKKEGNAAESSYKVEQANGAYVINGTITIEVTGCSIKAAPGDDTSNAVNVKYSIQNASEETVGYSDSGWKFVTQDGTAYVPAAVPATAIDAGGTSVGEVTFLIPKEATSGSITATYVYGSYNDEMAAAVAQMNAGSMSADDIAAAYGTLPGLNFKFNLQ